MRRLIWGAALALCTGAGASCLAQGDPWPMFRFLPEHSGRSEWSGCATGTLSWSYPTGHTVESSPAVGSDGTAYFGSFDERFYAVAPFGALTWSYDIGDFVASSAALDRLSGHVYAGACDKRLYAFTYSGALAWSYATGQVIWGSSPAVDSGGNVYIGSWDNRLHVFSSAGARAWSYATAGDIHSSPAVAGDRVLVGSEEGRLYVFGSSGGLAWSYATAQTIHLSSPAVASDGAVYLGETATGTTPVACNLYAFGSSGGLAWSYATGDDVTSSPAIGWGEEIVVGSGDGNLYTLNPDGSLWWSYGTGEYVQGSPAVDADGMIFIGSVDHRVYALGSMGTLAWSYTTNGPVLSSPGIGFGGTVYVGSFDNALYVFGATPPELTPTQTPTPTETSGPERTPTPSPTPLFLLEVSDNRPAAGDSFAVTASIRPLTETFDAYGVVLGGGGAWSFDLEDPGALAFGVRPLVSAVPGLTAAWRGMLFRLDSIPESLRGNRFTFIAGLVPAGAVPVLGNAIPGYSDVELVEVR